MDALQQASTEQVMLAALKGAHDDFQRRYRDCDADFHEPVWIAIRDAIAKAEGK